MKAAHKSGSEYKAKSIYTRENNISTIGYCIDIGLEQYLHLHHCIAHEITGIKSLNHNLCQQFVHSDRSLMIDFQFRFLHIYAFVKLHIIKPNSIATVIVMKLYYLNLALIY